MCNDLYSCTLPLLGFTRIYGGLGVHIKETCEGNDNLKSGTRYRTCAKQNCRRIQNLRSMKYISVYFNSVSASHPPIVHLTNFAVDHFKVVFLFQFLVV